MRLGLVASGGPAVTVSLASGPLRERIGGAQLVGIDICTVAVARLALG